MRYFFVLLFIALLFLMHEVKAAPTCQVQDINGSYVGAIISNIKRVPKTTFKLPIPAKTPIAMDSYFNSCIIYPDHTPVQNTTVVLYDQSNEWNVTTKTAVTGCFNMTIPADVNFSIKAINPKDKTWSYYRAYITSAKKGKLLDDPKDHVFPFDNDLINIALMKPETGFKKISATYNSFKGTANMSVKENKHSMVIGFPSHVGKKYIVKFKTDKPMTVWFSDDSRKGHNPAKVSGGTGKLITLDALTATKTRTRLYFRPEDGKTNTVTNLSIKLADK